MHGVGPGTVLGGRYALRRRLSQGRDLERWSAHDTTLERHVALTIVDADHPNGAGILDAARRAAGVDDPRLVRILDVGTQDGSSYFVEEGLDGAESLAAILLRGALPAEEARRIAGEVASGLETARQRGLHHLRLTPHRVLRVSDGAIKVSGVAVDEAVEDAREPDPAAASRRDAICVVAVAYAALTGRWPLDDKVSGIEPAPRVVGGVPAPSEIAAGVPGDLDALCRMTLNEDTGPLTPGDFASQIAPWSRDLVHRVELAQTLVIPTHNVTPLAPASRSSEAVTPAGRAAPAAGPSAGDRALAAGTVATSTVATNTLATNPVANNPVANNPVGSNGVAGNGVASDTVGSNAVDPAVVGAGVVAGVVGKAGLFARAAADKASAFARAAADKAGATGADDDLGERMTLGDALWTDSEEAAPPLPMLPASTAQDASRDQSKVVVTIVSAFVAFSLLVAYCGARDMGGSGTRSSATPKPTATIGAAPVPAAPPSAPPAVPTGGPPIAILSATGFDPQGDGQEKNTQAPRVYDGSTVTAWTSEGYGSASFGGLGKKGVGVRLDLGQPTAVNEVTIDLGNGPVDVTVYAATKDSLDAATVIGAANAATGRIQLKATTPVPATQYVIVWFTSLAPDGGRFRASISEIALSGP